jgi:hypothetical protein
MAFAVILLNMCGDLNQVLHPGSGLKLYECTAVERTLDTRPTIHAGETIGLLLKDTG